MEKQMLSAINRVFKKYVILLSKFLQKKNMAKASGWYTFFNIQMDKLISQLSLFLFQG